MWNHEDRQNNQTSEHQEVDDDEQADHEWQIRKIDNIVLDFVEEVVGGGHAFIERGGFVAFVCLGFHCC